MRAKFDQQLDKLNAKMIEMGNAIKENISQAIEALVKKDAVLAQKILEGDSVIDQMQRDIESICFNLLIQQQPVAKDLRSITAAMKMVTDMERIGDHAADISEITVLFSKNKIEVEFELITKMAAEAIDMLIRCVDAYTRREKEIAHWVIDRDDVVDELFVRVKNELIQKIQLHEGCGEEEVDLLMIAKYLERIADHATNIAEWVLYSLENKVENRED